MFGLGGRKKYNGIVDTKLNNEYQIETRNNKNFPGMLAYLELIDNAWNSKMSADEGALYIATLYYCGILKHGLRDTANQLYSRIQSISRFGINSGTISQERWMKFSAAIAKAKIEAAVSPPAIKETEASPEINIEYAAAQLKKEFDISLDAIPDRTPVDELFGDMSRQAILSQSAQVALLYRLVAMNYLAACKLMRDDGHKITAGQLTWLNDLLDRSIDWSEKSSDHIKFEQITSQLNDNIVSFLESFGIYRG
ncbi:hypothetical protein ACIGFL_13470 [Pseudomonas sp. NPDC077649]|jgi:hypothetical protein|uniref:hypothetical protein n=1 Tax=unclassified Pseudomonas TaxID=196821 RepID=UPI0037C5B9A3